MQTSISQKFSLSLILYLFYNADLLKIINKLDIAAFDLRFVDDVSNLDGGRAWTSLDPSPLHRHVPLERDHIVLISLFSLFYLLNVHEL
jgi:hypothetical protein